MPVQVPRGPHGLRGTRPVGGGRSEDDAAGVGARHRAGRQGSVARLRGGALGEGPRGHGADRRSGEASGLAARREPAGDEAEDGADDEDQWRVLAAVPVFPY